MYQKEVGIVGTGLLGMAIAERFSQQGYHVVGFDVDSSRRQQLSNLGCLATESLQELTEHCRRIVFSLPNSDVVSGVVDELHDRAGRVKFIIDTTTGDPETTVAVARRLARQGIGYLDATVAGSSEQTRHGDIVVMVGGEPQHVEQCQDILDALARHVFLLGAPGSGATMKLIVNLVLGLNRAVLAEGLSLAKKSGVDLSKALEVLKSGAAYSKAMDIKGDKMINEDFAPQARLSQHLKDVELILSLAKQRDASVPLSSTHRTLLQQAERLGFGNMDNSAIIKSF